MLSASIPPVLTRVIARPDRSSRTLSRYLGGTFSPTTQMIRLADGREARTDLIRLNPDVDGYSLDLEGHVPTAVSRYRTVRAGDALASDDPRLAVILAHSYPWVDLATLSRRLRDAGFPLGHADLRAHEAIAATQAAVWHVTNGVDLDVRPGHVPNRLLARRPAGPPDHVDPAEPRWVGRIGSGRPLVLEARFDGRPQLGSYHLTLGSGEAAAVSVHLERSSARAGWLPVPSSAATVTLAGGVARPSRVDVVLGVGATLADGSGGGYRAYRLVIEVAGRPRRLAVEGPTFTLSGTPTYANPERVVHLYRHLVASALPDRGGSTTLSAVRLTRPASAVLAGPGWSGPYFLTGLPAEATARVETAGAPGAQLVDVAGRPLAGHLDPDQPFFVRHDADLRQDDLGDDARLVVRLRGLRTAAARVLVGCRTHSGPGEFTPVVHADTVAQEAICVFRLVDLTNTGRVQQTQSERRDLAFSA